jgi:hypothetical protein
MFRFNIRRKPEAAPSVAMDGVWSRKFWATREAGNTEYVLGYWNGRHKLIRHRIAETIAALEARRVLEIGAHCGVNLWAIGQKRPYDWLVGLDLSPHVVAAGQKLLAADLKVPHALHLGAADAIPYPDASFDAVLCAGVLVCVGPESIKQTLAELRRVTRRYLVLCEPFDDTAEAATFEGREDRYPNTTYWIRNYRALIECLWTGAVQRSIEHLPPGENIGHLNSIMVIEKAA